MEQALNDICKMTLLYVEDDAFIREMIGRILSMHYPDYELVFAESGIDALGKIEEHQPDIFMVDYFMPDLDGFRLSEKIMQHNKESGIIIVSGCTNDEIIEKFINIGVTHFVTKPINYSVLFSKIDSISESIFLNKLNAARRDV
jgi:YesN/AraC family two-component response regulator